MKKQKEKIDLKKEREIDFLRIIRDLEQRILLLEARPNIQYIPYTPQWVPGPSQTPQFPPINPGPYYYNSGGNIQY